MSDHLRPSPWSGTTVEEQARAPSWMKPARVEVERTAWGDPRASSPAPGQVPPAPRPPADDLADHALDGDESGADFEGEQDGAQALEPAAPDPMQELAPLVEEARAGLANARKQIEQVRRQALAASERDLVALSVAIAERVIGRALKLDPALVAGWAREGLEALAADDTVKVHVSPRVAQALKELDDAFGPGVHADIVVDDRLRDHDCEVRGRWGRVDAGVKARLDAVISSLGLPDEDTQALLASSGRAAFGGETSGAKATTALGAGDVGVGEVAAQPSGSVEGAERGA